MIKSRLLAALALSLGSSAAMANAAEPEFSIGAGIGIPYAVIGLNASAKVNDTIDVVGAIGTVGELAWSAGIQAYPMPDSGFRTSIFYGTNGATRVERCDWTCEDPEWEGFTGLSVGLGWGARAGDSGLTGDVIFLLTSGVFDEVDRLEEQGYEVDGSYGRVKISVGYQF